METPNSVAEFYQNLSGLDEYKGIQMLAAKGLHEHLVKLATHDLPKHAKILDVGCGRGALSLRLHDADFKVTACDMYDLCECKSKIEFIHINANDYELNSDYDAVFIVEVLEHTEDPFSVIRKYAKHLKNDGVLYITSPSTDSLFSRAWFFLTGRHWYFDDKNIITDGHIMPIHKFQMSYIAKELHMTLTNEDCLESRTANFGFLSLSILFLRIYNKLKRIPRDSGTVTIYRLYKNAFAHN